MRVSVLASVLASVLLSAPLAGACLTVSPVGKEPVGVGRETAVIAWDAATRTERFVRTATFTETDGPMAFLVPTPAPPRLEAVPDLDLGLDLDLGAIHELRAQVAPRVVERKRPVYRLGDDWGFGLPTRFAAKASKSIGLAGLMYAGDRDDVTVLGQSAVGGYDTAVLRASDPRALVGWLRGHGFAIDARTERWLRPYAEKGWAITAFRFRPKGRTYSTEPVCLTFRTDRPYYPYREPASASSPATRRLRVFLIAPGRRAGRLDGNAWDTAADYAGPLNRRAAMALTGIAGLTEGDLKGRWLTAFVDRRATRPEGELWFDADADGRPVEPPPIVKDVNDPVLVPRGLAASVVGAPVLGLVALVLRHRRR